MEEGPTSRTLRPANLTSPLSAPPCPVGMFIHSAILPMATHWPHPLNWAARNPLDLWILLQYLDGLPVPFTLFPFFFWFSHDTMCPWMETRKICLTKMSLRCLGITHENESTSSIFLNITVSAAPMVNFIWQFDQFTQCPSIWSHPVFWYVYEGIAEWEQYLNQYAE